MEGKTPATYSLTERFVWLKTPRSWLKAMALQPSSLHPFEDALGALDSSVPIPAETQNVVPLDGAWRFKLEQAPKPPWALKQMGPLIPIKYLPTFEPFYTTEYREDTNWHGITVPGNWEIAGFSPATYNQPDNASGFYRVKFFVPSEWSGRLVKVNFDGVQNGCEIWCNGQPGMVQTNCCSGTSPRL